MKHVLMTLMATMALMACTKSVDTADKDDKFDYRVDRFADLEVLRYKVDDFDSLTLQQKTLLYYLSQAALEGRDIIYDQNCKYNLCIRQTLEAIYTGYHGDKNSKEFKALEVYLKRVWFSNGIHHHYSGDKFLPEFSEEWFHEALMQVKHGLPLSGPGNQEEQKEALYAALRPVLFDPAVLPKRVNQQQGQDLVRTSACNFYENVSQAEAEAFYNQLKDPQDTMSVSWGLNSRLQKDSSGIHEQTYMVGGLYSSVLERIIYWLTRAEQVAETNQQKAVIHKLIEYYRTGSLKTYDDYCILWVEDLDSRVDFINGFTETYGDPLGMKGSWEGLVDFKSLEATKRTEKIARNAQWFEDHSPVDPQFRKEKVTGVSAKVITAAILAGDEYPSTAIGINLPNSNWIRHQHGSKSVTIENITDAYNQAAAGNGFNEEFVWSAQERKWMEEYGNLTDNLHTDLHECLGHGSGRLLDGVDPDALKEYGSTIEEARADLFGLYYCADPKMVELGLLPNKDAYKAEYYRQMMNGALTQLTRIELGKTIEEAHMRNRALIANWVLAQAKTLGAKPAAEIVERNGKHYMVVRDYPTLRQLFGKLLREIQRIKSTGDYQSARQLVEQYAVRVDPKLHQEILARYKKLNLAPYKGFVNPMYTAVTDRQGNITDVTVNYNENFVEQQLRYSRTYSNLSHLLPQ